MTKKLEAVAHATNPNIVKVPGLNIIRLPASEGGGFALSGYIALEIKRLIDDENARKEAIK